MKEFRWTDEVEREWDKRASYWNKRSKFMWDEGSRKEIIPFISKHIPYDARILDVGCGDGYGSYKLNHLGYDVVGVDLSKEMIEHAKKYNNITFLQADVRQLPFEDQTFDGVMAINVLEWMEIPASALDEMARVCKPNATICIGILGPTAGPRKHHYPKVYGEASIINSMMPWEFQKLAEEKGFRYIDGFAVHKKEVKQKNYEGLSNMMQQALSFMWVFILRKEEGYHHATE